MREVSRGREVYSEAPHATSDIRPSPEFEQALRNEGIVVQAELTADVLRILTPSAVRFVAHLVRLFSRQRDALLEHRAGIQQALDAGRSPSFLPETSHLRQATWRVASAPADLLDRRVEITGPAGDRKMVINALNSGARVYMADFEDAQSPTWQNVIQGQINLLDAVRGTIRHTGPDGRVYALQYRVATLMMRPRGWHLVEKHFLVDGIPSPAAIVDFALYYFHNARELLDRGTGPYFYLPKLENHLEARLWRDIFAESERLLGLPHGTIRATVLIETVLAAFEMDEILFELRDYSAGLNCGRWDYIFSFIKKFRNNPRCVFPDRASVTMDKGFLSAYARLLVKTCHRRGAHAIGGMAAYIPVRSDPEKDRLAMEKVREDKEREVHEGYDGTWVAHPGLVPVAQGVFDAAMRGSNQLHVLRPDVTVEPRDLLAVPSGRITDRGLRSNLSVSLQYLESWLRGTGAVPINNLMEDTATAEISRAQVWQWLHHHATLDDGRRVTPDLVDRELMEELAVLHGPAGNHLSTGRASTEAAQLLRELVMSEEFIEFLTLRAYNNLHSTNER